MIGNHQIPALQIVKATSKGTLADNPNYFDRPEISPVLAEEYVATKGHGSSSMDLQVAQAPPQLVFSPMQAQRMARREFQNPSVLERDTAHGRVWYIR